MKYGQRLTGKMNPVWEKYNIEYHQLIQQLKLKHGEKWKIKNEEVFKNSLEKELNKVCEFLQLQSNKARRQLQYLESTPHSTSSSSFNIQQYEKENITSLIFYIHDISNYLLTNKNGFNKMVTKHDQYCVQFTLKQYYNQHIQTQFQTYEQQLDQLFLRSSKLYDLYRSSSSLPPSLPPSLPTTTTTSSSSSSSSTTTTTTATTHRHHANNSLSSTSTSSTLSPTTVSSPSSSSSLNNENHYNTTFWIHPHHINELKAILLFYLPIISQQQENDHYHHHHHNKLNTVYFDNSHMDVYKEKIKRCNNHNNNNNINNHMKGENNDGDNEKLLLLLKCQWYNNNLSEMKIEYQEEQNHQVIKKSTILDGTTLSTCFYNNNTFSSSSSESLLMNNNSKDDHHSYEIMDWIQQKKLIPQCQSTCQRTIYSQQKEMNLEIYLDTNIQFFEMNSSSSSSSSSSFPYGLLTISSSLSSLPNWLNDILSSHLVYSVSRFSLYIHSQSLLCTSQLPIHPYWLTIKEMDLLSSNKNHHIGLSRSFITLQPLINGHRPHSFDGDHSIIHLDSDSDSDQRQQNEKGKTIYYQFKYWIKEKCSIMNQQKNKTMILKNNKLTEPKTHFANERTFITWLQLCATFLVISLNLINHGDWVSRTMGSILIFICCLLSIYALGRFQYRGWQLRTRKYVLRYDDVMGPTFLCSTLILAMTMNLYFRYPLIIEAIQSL